MTIFDHNWFKAGYNLIFCLNRYGLDDVKLYYFLLQIEFRDQRERDRNARHVDVLPGEYLLYVYRTRKYVRGRHQGGPITLKG